VQLSVVNGIVVLAGALVFLEAISIFRLFSIALIVIGTGFLHGPARKEPFEHAPDS
jgi:multidrug transporter EmrE-like cation transporter